LKLLLDHCMPRRFGRLLLGHEVIHTSRLGWGDLKNGQLLAAAEGAGFDVMVTVDRSMRFQQNLTGRNLSVIFLLSPGNDAPTLSPLADLVLDQLGTLPRGSVVTIKHPDWM
jgi:predicted nuclease of predicted toxin-antitoxin system